MTPARRLTVALVGLIALVVVGYFARDVGGGSTAPTSAPATSAPASGVPGADSGLPVEPLSRLPAEAARTWQLIGRGGPFPHPEHDGARFHNRERRLPAKSGEYYREYTVPTPGSPDRGARRLVTGERDEVYYTGDHYESFVVVDVTR
ncbi:ribonuclease domain-containing protein [Saccharothrix coeruleofusca]|uniref:Ribonuclease N1 n=1 Tax=Saccharothrix coeruleofusca TaxID=33919 RepID=A0A918AHZ8_9PSEU|nr:ribonuclease domain-containing protein [Saccharothrix coeruleofusca]MBP2334244.1 guanyl-specific ribonuclease Sa [Saccharothrix coeruleofusca]GGP42388.1 ribonuclease N1 [Saccharothrix coeruleofusca]